MNKRAFYTGAIFLVIAALFTHAVARSFLEEATHRKTVRVSEASKQRAPYVADPLAVQASHKYNLLTTVGIVLTAISVLCIVTALIRREPGWYFIWLLLLVFAVVVPMIL